MTKKYEEIKVSQQELLDKIESLRKSGRFFTVWFIKKDFSQRRMTCRFGVTSHLKGGQSTLNEHLFFTVFDMGSQEYRAVSKERVFKLRAGGKEYSSAK